MFSPLPQARQKIVVTGASGFIGRQLVARLVDGSCEVLLVGRDLAVLQAAFPGFACCTYDDLAQRATGFDLLVHLAVLNNTSTEAPEAFDRVNVQLLSEVVDHAKAAKIAQFVNVTSFHALGHGTTPYATSKRKALEFLQNVEGIKVTNLFLPAVYGDAFAGRLSVITKFPAGLRGVVRSGLSALAPTVHVDRIAEFLKAGAISPDRDVFLADPQDRNFVFRVGKALLDILFVIGILGVFWWLLLIIWIMIPLDSPGPGLFRQVRVGKDGKPFTVYKFRTMKRGTRQAGTHEMTADSVTRIGAFLRKTKLDELPQVFNILRGNLSLIGPRPCLPVQTVLIEERTKRGVFSVRPGISGLAQINDIDMSDPVKLAQWDARYIAQRSLPAEVSICIKTFIGKGASDKIAK